MRCSCRSLSIRRAMPIARRQPGRSGDTLCILREVRARHGIAQSSSLNLFLSDGRMIAGLRFTFDFGCYATEDWRRIHEANLRFLSMWFTVGSRYGLAGGEGR